MVELEKHEIFSKYSVIEKISENKYHSVYLCKCIFTERKVVIKLITSKDNFVIERFKREKKILSSIEHCKIVKLLDAGETYFVMEYVEGNNLTKWKDRTKEEINYIMLQLSETLNFLQKNSIVHRDIKPSNIMIDAANNIKLIDFGLAKSRNDFTITLDDEFLGSPAYVSPEQCKNSSLVDYRSDIYSLAAVWYYLRTGKTLYSKTDSMSMLVAHSTDKAPLFPDKESRNIFSKMLIKNPDERLSDLDELIRFFGNKPKNSLKYLLIILFLGLLFCLFYSIKSDNKPKSEWIIFNQN